MGLALFFVSTPCNVLIFNKDFDKKFSTSARSAIDGVFT